MVKSLRLSVLEVGDGKRTRVTLEASGKGASCMLGGTVFGAGTLEAGVGGGGIMMPDNNSHRDDGY